MGRHLKEVREQTIQMCRMCVPGRGNGRCKGREAGTSVVFLKNEKPVWLEQDKLKKGL